MNTQNLISTPAVIPAQAGIQKANHRLRFKHLTGTPWIPACAGMTEMGVILAHAGIQKANLQLRFKHLMGSPWIPAFAGMTEEAGMTVSF